jgi:uncharacterized protein YbjT (DUF2867 family)
LKKVILFGASGNLGKQIAKAIVVAGYELTVVLRKESHPDFFKDLKAKIIIAEVCKNETLVGILENQDIVISTLGKSVSINDFSKPSYYDVDFLGNSNILKEAQKHRINKFVYVYAFHAEKYLHLEYFKVHHDFSELLIKSGLDYSIIKPPAIFSAFVDIINMAKKGQLINMGEGDKLTNPIFEGDLAKILVGSINQSNCIIEAGGKKIYSRKQTLEIIQNNINPNKKLLTLPLFLFKMTLPILKIISKNTFDKFSFFIEVLQHDTIAPKLGDMTFEDYVAVKVKNG